MNTYKLRYKTPQGIIAITVDAWAYPAAIQAGRRDPLIRPEYDILDCRLVDGPEARLPDRHSREAD